MTHEEMLEYIKKTQDAIDKAMIAPECRRFMSAAEAEEFFIREKERFVDTFLIHEKERFNRSFKGE